MIIADSLGCGRTDRGNLRPTNLARVIIKFVKDLEKRVYTIRAGEHNPIVNVRDLDEFGEFTQICRRFDFNGRQFENVGTERAQLIRQHARLFPCPRHHDSFARKRSPFVPI